ncbi:polyribonucleotide nucleotidyltransferase [Candidatus Adlerbacteria bacterium RIFCSPHIGHO2_02_FULL_54_18]|uniref:Polyribonucleotide nucleotidyltransferase n=1 Tax=Candidatus Adlerbacteria bacterium RIFCSPHIGHO2_02_FULL_54_18 TaxID=1797241 RepID=A0A1F4Y4Z4_9BACT|nr:MAG: polyribonucleotide nucleotidyltransferase [Candidatus Adlerbacteria bacterium RIFCSPHIGHO2_02_FULL_54_18]
MQTKTYSLEVGGKKMVAEFSDLAEQANGSVILRYGNTAVLATAVISSKTRDDIDYFPLTVDYEERFYAAGAILGSRFMRREGRPSDAAILSGRIVDRTIRPLFPQHIRNEVQVVITVLALGEEKPAMIAVNAASLALAVSDIPWQGPVASIHIVESNFDLLCCGKDGTINMIEVGAQEASEEDIAAGFAKSVEEHNKILAWQKQIIQEIGKPKRDAAAPVLPQALLDLFEGEFKAKITPTVFCGVAGKDEIHHLTDEWMACVKEVGQSDPSKSDLLALKSGTIKRFIEDKVDEEIHRGAVEDNVRADNRRFDEVRPLFAKAGGVSPILHGSGVFYRGGTHVFTALTLGGPGDSQIIDSMEEHNIKKRFMHHYNFPPYSAGETGRMGGINRRATGHGALAEKALAAVIPSAEQFPYTIRLVSECFASNGSTSMGSACASTLALMDGGVPIKRPVAGIAMGLMSSSTRSRDGVEGTTYKILTDIQGPEDEFGGMDFKVAGTREGITAIQLDIKLDGIPMAVLKEALEGGKKARLHILDVIEKEIAEPRTEISPRAPEILTMKVKPDQIGLVIGGGGKTINGIKDVSKVDDITIEDDGSIFITGKGGTAQMAKQMIEQVVKEYKAGEVYDGEVTRLMDFGAFVRVGPGKDAEGLVHVSEIAPFRIEKIAGALSVGEKVRVMIKEIDEKGRINLSIKQVDPDFASRKGILPAQNNGGFERRERPGPHA